MSHSSIRKVPVASLQAVGTGVLCAFFVSGACGLIHEVAWTRLLRLVMGNTTFSITTVLCAFMGGLALGSYLGGRIIDRRDDPLRVFAFLEGTIALYCFVLPWLIDGTQPIYRLIYQNTHTSFYVFSLIRFVFSGLLLLVPATLMGATLPVLSRFFVRSPERLGWSVGILYAVNTFGAVLGASATGFLLIPHLGVLKTIYLACVFNTMVCVVSYLLYRQTLVRSQESVPGATRPKKALRPKRKKRPEPVTDRRLPYGQRALVAVLIGYAFSGFAALVYEIAWTRALSLLIGSTVYAFSMMLTAFVLGLAVGSMLYARFVDRVRDPMRALAVIEVAIGLSALAVVPFIDRLPFFVTDLISRFSESFWLLQLVEFALILLIMLVPTVLMGAAFPLANRLFNQESTSVGRSVGTVYGCNTVGTILGSFVGGFILIPWIGIQHTIFAAVSVNILVGSVFFALSRRWSPVPRWLVAASVIVLAGGGIAFTPTWDVSLMSFGPFHEAARVSRATAQSRSALEELAGKSEVLFHKEGLSTTVTVKQIAGRALALYINGKPDASSLSDLASQEMVAHVPLLLHSEPRSALVIGLASGITLGSAGLYPVEHLDCVEIEPAIIEACRYFDEYNYHILDDPRVNVIIADGRNYLALTQKTYDVIMSQPSNPYFAGIADLFTREFFQVCRQHLAAQGIMCTWLQSYHMDLESFRSIVRTFHSVFPNMTLWRTGKSDCLLVGSKGRLAVDYKVLTQRMRTEAIAADLKRIEINTIPDYLGHLVMGQDGAKGFAQGAPIHTDDNALLEFSAPRALTREVYHWALVEAIEQYREADLSFLAASEHDAEALAVIKDQAARFIEARGHVFQAHIYMNQGLRDQAIAELRKAAALNPGDGMLKEFNAARHKEAFTLARRGQIRQAIDVYRTMLTILPNDEKAHYNLATLLKRQGKFEEAIAHYSDAVRLKPDYTYAYYNLGELAQRQGKVEEALKHYRRALLLMPELVPALNNLAWLLATYPDPVYRDVPAAIRLAEKACELMNNKEPLLLYTLSVTYAAAGRFSDAQATAKKALNLVLATGNHRLAEKVRKGIKLYEGQQ
jgi:spermidine synthase